MMPPIRCFTCGALVADKFEEYQEKIKNGKKIGAALDELGCKRYCCRRMFISHLDIVDEVIAYKSH